MSGLSAKARQGGFFEKPSPWTPGGAGFQPAFRWRPRWPPYRAKPYGLALPGLDVGLADPVVFGLSVVSLFGRMPVRLRKAPAFGQWASFLAKAREAPPAFQHRVSQVKIAVLGAGAIGSYYGAILARSGEEIHLIGRGDHVRAMRENGLRVESASEGGGEGISGFPPNPSGRRKTPARSGRSIGSCSPSRGRTRKTRPPRFRLCWEAIRSS